MSNPSEFNSDRVTDQEIRDLAERAGKNGQGSVAGILHCLAGSMIIDREQTMFYVLGPYIFAHMDELKERLRTERN